MAAARANTNSINPSFLFGNPLWALHINRVRFKAIGISDFIVRSADPGRLCPRLGGSPPALPRNVSAATSRVVLRHHRDADDQLSRSRRLYARIQPPRAYNRRIQSPVVHPVSSAGELWILAARFPPAQLNHLQVLPSRTIEPHLNGALPSIRLSTSRR